MASLEMNVSVIKEMEELDQKRNEATLAILEANVVKEPMKCKHTRGKLSQHSLIEIYANEFQNLCA
jgi:hypothetical protein